MFFNRQDIDWFKPVELSSKYGRRGKKEHLQFDGFFFFLKVYFSIIATSMFRSMLDHRGLKLDGAIGQGEICNTLKSEKFSKSFLSHIGKN